VAVLPFETRKLPSTRIMRARLAGVDAAMTFDSG
jgi:hypothetical protein